MGPKLGEPLPNGDSRLALRSFSDQLHLEMEMEERQSLVLVMRHDVCLVHLEMLQGFLKFCKPRTREESISPIQYLSWVFLRLSPFIKTSQQRHRITFDLIPERGTRKSQEAVVAAPNSLSS